MLADAVHGRATDDLRHADRGPFWSVRPAGVLIAAVVVAQTTAALVSVYGIFMEPIGWERAGADDGIRAGEWRSRFRRTM